MTETVEYQVRIENRAITGWQEFVRKYPDEMTEFKIFLKTQPTNSIVTNGKVKKLKGRLEGILQFDVSYSERIRCEVDKKNRVVSILYAGGHP